MHLTCGGTPPLSAEDPLADLDNYKLEENSFDLILCFYFLNRSLFKEIERAVKPGGLVIFETFTIDHLKYCDFKKEWVLSPNELLKVFSDFSILRYQEVDRNEKGFASLIARK